MDVKERGGVKAHKWSIKWSETEWRIVQSRTLRRGEIMAIKSDEVKPLLGAIFVTINSFFWVFISSMQKRFNIA
jgi:hypothetical protein